MQTLSDKNANPLAVVRHGEGGRVSFHCPACGFSHGVTVPRWSFNGDVVSPTFSPSVLVTGVEPSTAEELDAFDRGVPLPERPLVCHSFVRNGKIEFLGDCTHALAGKTVPLQPF